MLRIRVREEVKKGRIQAAGKIAGPWVAELENTWRSVQAPGKEIEIDLKDFTYVDEAGRQLLSRMRQQGAHLVDAANLGVNLAKDEVVQANDRVGAGVANNIEVITGHDDLARANDNQIAALYSYNQARTDLARATGQMEALYSK